MSAAFLPRYTTAQLEAHERIKAIRARQKATMIARLQEQAAKEKAAAEEAKRRSEAVQILDIRKMEAARALTVARMPEHRAYKGSGLIVSRLAFDDALARISEAYEIPEDVILSPCRNIKVVEARTHLTVLLAKENPYASLPSLGRAVGRDHTTVLHSLRRWNEATGENVRMVGLPAQCRYVLQFKPVRERGEAPQPRPVRVEPIVPTTQRFWTNEELETVRRMKSEGRKRYEICRALNRSYDSIDKVLQRLRNEAANQQAAA